ncbi:MAG: transcriptional regulator, partial [Acidobacteriales bacterium]|nr:transcriptional regulator [Terriglobales bacterium]
MTAGLTIEGIARAANVNRTTIYRRWPSKGALLLAVIEPLLERFDHDPDTGSLGGDLLALMLMIGENVALPEGQAVRRAVGSTSDELKELVDVVNDRALGAFRRAFDRARDRGEVGPTDDTEVMTHFGVLRRRALGGDPRARAHRRGVPQDSASRARAAARHCLDVTRALIWVMSVAV